MAELTKSRARKPLAFGEMTVSLSSTNSTKHISLNLLSGEMTPNDRSTWYKLDLTMKEAVRIARMAAGALTHDPFTKPGGYILDQRKASEKLRALADLLEAEGK